ncbi:MAG: response regulator transcription factor [Bifidobacteriaceae bacterium]|jgi:DNA-binding NarL/FixJ family response regulator|nr:response regulator transcription factor [Bifidobacteriaceae bacterium]
MDEGTGARGGAASSTEDSGGGRAAIRAVLADDQALVRDGLAVLLASTGEIEVVGEAANGAEAIAVAASARPDVVVMDIRMPVMDGIEATARLTREKQDPGAKPHILILTTFDHDDYVYDALAAGASGFLLKDASVRELIDAVKIVDRGDAMLAPSVTRRLIAVGAFKRRRSGDQASACAAAASLTPRELEVLEEMARGLSNAEIAESLVLSEQTIKTHVAHILGKLEVRDRTQAVVFAFENGLTPPR